MMNSILRKLIPIKSRDKNEYDTIILKGVKRSPKWDSVRQSFISDNGRKCTACGSSKFLNVHHIKPFHLYPSLELDKTNLIILCENKTLPCHLVFGHLLNWAAWNPDVTTDAGHYYSQLMNRRFGVIEE